MITSALKNFIGKKNVRYFFLSVVTILLATLLISRLIKFAGINLNILLSTIQDFPLWFFFTFLGMTFLNFGIGAYKWKFTVEFLSVNADKQPSYWFYFIFTILGAFLGLFMPIQISTLAVRSISFRFGGYGSLQKGAVTSLVSQFQDVVVISFFFLAGALILLGNVSVLVWFLIICLLFFCGFIFFNYLAHPLTKKVSAITLPNTKSDTLGIRLIKILLNLFGEIYRKGFSNPNLTIPLYWLSIIRFFNLAGRSVLLSCILGLEVSPIYIFSISSVVQLSLLIAITPGNLGLLEWGWVGLLTLANVSKYDAGQFALANRVLSINSTVFIFTITFVLIGLFYFLYRTSILKGKR